MSESITVRLFNPVQAHAELQRAWVWAKSMLMAGHRLLCRLEAYDPKTREQEKHYHAQMGDIAAQVPVRGELMPAEDMKRLLLSAFRLDTLTDPDLAPYWQKLGDMRMVPGLRGEIVIVGIQSRKFPKFVASAFIEWLNAFGSEHGVRWTDPAMPMEESDA